MLLFSPDKPGSPLTVVPSTKAILFGNNVTFQCQYRDGSQDEVTWEKKNGVLPNGRYFVDKGVLTITDAEKSDAGTYVCRVNTGIDDLITEAKLEVQCKYFLNKCVVVVVVVSLRLQGTLRWRPIGAALAFCSRKRNKWNIF